MSHSLSILSNRNTLRVDTMTFRHTGKSPNKISRQSWRHWSDLFEVLVEKEWLVGTGVPIFLGSLFESQRDSQLSRPCRSQVRSQVSGTPWPETWPHLRFVWNPWQWIFDGRVYWNNMTLRVNASATLLSLPYSAYISSRRERKKSKYMTLFFL